MADMIVNALLLEGPPQAVAAAERAAMDECPGGDLRAYPTDRGVELVFHTYWTAMADAWMSGFSRSHPELQLTLGWEGASGSDVGWRRWHDGAVVASEDLDVLAWATPGEWAEQGRALMERGGISCLFED